MKSAFACRRFDVRCISSSVALIATASPVHARENCTSPFVDWPSKLHCCGVRARVLSKREPNMTESASQKVRIVVRLCVVPVTTGCPGASFT